MQLWSPYQTKNGIALERVQGRFTGTLPGIECFSYEDILERLNFVLLLNGEGRGNPNEVNNIMRGVDEVNNKKHFLMADRSVTRGHGFKE